MASVTCSSGQMVELEKNPVITASRPSVCSVRSLGKSAATTPRRLRSSKTSQRSRPKMRERRCRHGDGIALAGHGLDERGFAAAVGAEDGDVLAAGDSQGNIVKDGFHSAGHGDVLEFDEGVARH